MGESGGAAAVEPSPLAVMGVGEPPAVSRRFNWGAFLMPGWWSLLHGLWLWWLIDIAIVLVGLSVGAVLRKTSPLSVPLQQLSPVSAFYVFVKCGVALWFGVRGNARVWKREVSRTARGARRRLVSQYLWGERVWTWIGIASYAFGVYTLWTLVFDEPAKFIGGAAGGWIAFAGDLVALAIAVTLSKRFASSSELPHA